MKDLDFVIIGALLVVCIVLMLLTGSCDDMGIRGRR